MINKTVHLFLIGVLIALSSCQKEVFVESGLGLDDWSTETHSASTTPNYDVVFEQNLVNKIHLVFSEDEWDDMTKDLQDVNGGNSGGQGGGPGGGGETTFSDQTPLYFPADFYFNGVQWYDVGVRYKGNSSLTANVAKLPFRFNFDYFEDDYPEIYDQRFYGFKELTLSSGFNDESLMREKTACDLFRGFGVPAVQTAFYELYIDKGNGSYQYYGLYTMTEVVFESFLQDFFGSDIGNCYKPDGTGASFSESGWDLDHFEKKTNSTTGKGDIQCMYDALHADTRETDPESWKEGLESIFDVDGFLKYLAVNNTIQNWDTYGVMTHNYYLYNDPAIGKLRWIVWDNNEAFGSGNGNRQALSFSMDEVAADWPLISYVIADEEYEDIYKDYIDDFTGSVFSSSSMNTIYSNQELLLTESAESEEDGYTFLSNGLSSFSSAVNTLLSHSSERRSEANDYTAN